MSLTPRKKYPYSELFWSAFLRIRTEQGEIQSISPYSLRIRENTDQNNSKYGHFVRNESDTHSNFFFLFFFNKFFRSLGLSLKKVIPKACPFIDRIRLQGGCNLVARCTTLYTLLQVLKNLVKPFSFN